MAKKLTQEKALEILSDGRVHGKRLTRKQKKFFGAIAGGAEPYKAQKGTETNNILNTAKIINEEKKREALYNMMQLGAKQANPNVQIQSYQPTQKYKQAIANLPTQTGKNEQIGPADTRESTRLIVEAQAADRRRQQAIRNSALAQSFGALTPGGYNPGAGAIGADLATNILFAPVTGAGRLTQQALGYNPYGFGESTAGNIMGGLGMLGDVAGVGMIKMLPGSTGASSIPGAVGEYLTTKTLLRKAHNLNPWRFKADPEAYYHRSPNLENIVNQETGMLQGFGQSAAGRALTEKNLSQISGINLKRGANSQLYFAKGVPLDFGRYNTFEVVGKTAGQGYPGPYMVEVKGVPMGVSTKGSAPGVEPTKIGSYAVSKRPISLDEAKFYKEDWIRGYKQVKPPKKKQDGGAVEGTMGGLTDKGFNFNPAWGGAWRDGGDLPKLQTGDTFTPYSRDYLTNFRDEWVKSYNQPIPYALPTDDRFDKFFLEKRATVPEYYETKSGWVKGLGTGMEEFREGDKNTPPKSMGKPAKGYEWVENYKLGPFKDQSQIAEYNRLIKSVRNAESDKPEWNRDVKFENGGWLEKYADDIPHAQTGEKVKLVTSDKKTYELTPKDPLYHWFYGDAATNPMGGYVKTKNPDGSWNLSVSSADIPTEFQDPYYSKIVTGPEAVVSYVPETKRAATTRENPNVPFLFPDGTEKLWKDMDWRERAYVSGKNMGDWQSGNWTDWVNPVAMVGAMGEGVGTAPYLAEKTGSVLPYVSGAFSPMLTGALAGIGTKTVGQFAKNILNPVPVNIPKPDVSKLASVISEGVLPIRGAIPRYDEATEMFQKLLEKYPALGKTENFPFYFHGTSSANLPSILQSRGLRPFGQLSKEGRVPLKGELASGISKGGVNQQSVSTVFADDINKALDYSLGMAGKGKVDPVKKLDEWFVRGDRDEYIRLGGDNIPIFPKSEEFDDLFNRQLTEFQKLSPAEQAIVKENYPILFGMHPKVGASERFMFPRWGIEGEIGLKEGASFDEIPSVFVPKSKVRSLQKTLGNQTKVFPLEDMLADPELLKKFNEMGYGSTGFSRFIDLFKKNGGRIDKYADGGNLQPPMSGAIQPALSQQFAMGGSLPGSAGFTYARTGGTPSEGPYAKKTMPSAQNGMEMKYYQEGLDWKPKTISKNGGWLDKYDDAPKAQDGDVLEYLKKGKSAPVVTKGKPLTAEQQKRITAETLKRQAQRSKPLTATNTREQAVERGRAENLRVIEENKEYNRQAMAEGKAAEATRENPNVPFTFPTGETKLWKDMNWREQQYVAGKNLGSMLRSDNWTDYVNPLAMIGNMAEGLSVAPYTAQKTNSYLPYVTGIGAPLLTGAMAGIGAPKVGQFIENLVNPLPVSASKLTQPVAKAAKSTAIPLVKKIKNLPEGISKSDVENVVQKGIDWINSDEYIARRMANTGETRDQVVKSTKKWIDELSKKGTIEFKKELTGDNYGFYSRNQMFPFSKGVPRIVVKTTEGEPLETLHHEILHHFSPAQKSEKLYRNYPFLQVQKSKQPQSFKEALKEIFIKPKNVDEGSQFLDYLEDTAEQQVRAIRLSDKIRQDLGIKEFRKIEEPEFNKWIDEFYNPNSKEWSQFSKSGFADVVNLIDKAVHYNQQNIRPRLLDWMNKAWAVPAAVGTAGAAASSQTPNKQKGGGVVKDNNGYWNPENWGKVVEIDSNNITMRGVDQPLIGVSDTGDVQYMEPGNDYEFDGTKVREYPVAQGGRQVSSRTSGPRLPLSPSIPTAADSSLLYKNALEKERFYKNNPNYKVVDRDVVGETSLKDRKFLQELADESVATYNQFKKPNIYNDISSFGYSSNQIMVPNKVIFNKLGRVEGSNVLYKAPDVTRTIDTYHNPNAPVILFSPQIIPQGERVYFSETFGDRSRIPYYEPLAVKPYAMRTEKEKVEWEKKYGKPKPKPSVKKETPKTEAKKQQVSTTTPTTKKAPVKSVPQTTDQLSMFRNANVELLVDQFGNYEWFRKDDPGDMVPVRRATREEIEYSKKQKQRNGGVSVNKADEYPLEKLDNLLNFTNYNKPTAKNGKWLDKYK